MTIRISLLTILLFLHPAFCQAQEHDAAILMTVDGRKVEAGEFIRMYGKSLEPGVKLTVEDYLPRFTLFKQKVADAMHEGYDTTAAFREELNGYRNELARNYLTDTTIKNTLLKKAYERSLTEINAWHILISMPQNAAPADTMKAYKKAIDIRERLLAGEAFETVAKSASDDKSARFNGGNLGYFSVFQMIMPFEDAAYKLKKGTISKPVRSPFGYHIIKITDIRPSRGKVLVAHIMKNAPPGCPDEVAKKAEADINDIYLKLQSEEPFTVLAKEYSDHKESAPKGGVLNMFGAGEMIPDFAEQALAIADTGQYTKPFRTIYGWHIVKLLKKQPPGSFAETASWLESKINKSYLNSLCKKSFTDKLRKEYKFRLNTNSLNWFISNTDSSIIRGTAKYNRNGMPDGVVYAFSGGTMRNEEFADYVEKRGPLFANNDSALFIKNLADAAANDQLMSYENSLLEKKYPEFRYLMNEFHDGILLFDVSDKKIWQKLSHDTAGIHMYYEENKHKYLSPPYIDATIITLKKKNGARELQAATEKFSLSPDLVLRLSEKFNSHGDTILITKNGTWTKGENTDIDAVEWTVGVHHATIGGFPSIILVNKVTEALPLGFDEVAEKMMAGYQERLEKEWSEQLNRQYNVLVDKDVLDQVKTRLKNE
jgi:peptidyl-prolyl cis-trans isomerase SurA